MGRPIRHFDWLFDLGNLCKKNSQMKIIYALYRNQNDGKYDHSNEKIQFAGYVVVHTSVAICFEYSARPAYLKICVRTFIKPVV